MAKPSFGSILFGILIGAILGGILKDEVCKTNTQNLGFGESIMNITCWILSHPIESIILIVIIAGIIWAIVEHYKK